jgi:hypothetical protein
LPANRTLNPERARWASLSYWHPGSPEAQEAGRDFWCAKAIQDLKDALVRSPLPFTDEQRDQIIAVVLSAEAATESTDEQREQIVAVVLSGDPVPEFTLTP